MAAIFSIFQSSIGQQSAGQVRSLANIVVKESHKPVIYLGNKIVHFEIPVSDTQRMSKFYGDLFGWKFEKQNMPGLEYWMVSTTGSQNDLNGGMYKKMDDTDKPRFFIEVEEIDGHTEKFRQGGGTIVVEKQEIPGFGWSVLGTDPEGNLVGLYQPAQRPQQVSSQKKRTASASKKSKGKKSSSRKKKR